MWNSQICEELFSCFTTFSLQRVRSCIFFNFHLLLLYSVIFWFEIRSWSRDSVVSIDDILLYWFVFNCPFIFPRSRVMCKMETTTTDVNHDRHILKQPTKVLLTLSNVLLPKEKLTSTPSMIDGLDFETEVDLRIVGCEWIQTAGILLKLPQVRRFVIHFIIILWWCILKYCNYITLSCVILHHSVCHKQLVFSYFTIPF